MSVNAATLERIERPDLRPLLPVSRDALWNQAVALRDGFAGAIEATLKQENVQAEVVKSDPGNYPVWLRLDAWIPVEGNGPPRQRRSTLEVIVEAKPFNRHGLVSSARLTRGKESIALPARPHFSERDVVEWALYAIERGPRPSNYQPFVDRWLERFAAFIPPLSPRYNPIERHFSNPGLDWMIAAALVACVAMAVAVAYPTAFKPVAIAVGALVLISVILLAIFTGRSRELDWVAAQPQESPRHLGHVDSWHAVLIGLASDRDALMQRLTIHLAEIADGMLDIRAERYGYRGANRYEERERIVVSYRQGHVHLHVYPIGDDLFVGWQAHLNWAQWRETTPITSRHSGGHRVSFRDVMPSWYHPSEFDLIDLNSMSAIVHAEIEREVKALLTDRAIDQEIDFEVVRGDRGNALDRRKAWPERADTHRRNSNVIFGWGAVQRASMGEMQLVPVEDDGRHTARGLAAIPAVILVPLVAAAGYVWLYLSGGLETFRFQHAITPNWPFVFYPLFYLPFAVAVALGLVVYARIGWLRGLLVIALTEALSLGINYSYGFAVSYFIAPNDLRDLTLAALYSIIATGSVSIGYLFVISLWVPSLRTPGRWIGGFVFWTAWSVATTIGIRQLTGTGLLTPVVITVLLWGLRVVMAATLGFWLWRDLRPQRGAERARKRAPEAREQTVPGQVGAIVADAPLGRGVVILAIALLVVWGNVSFGEGYVLLTGLLLGSLYALIALPVVLTVRHLGVTNFIPFAAATLGPYGVLFLAHYGFGFWPSLMAAVVVTVLAAGVFEAVLLRGTYRMPSAFGALVTFGALLAAEGGVIAGFGPDLHELEVPRELSGVVGELGIPTYRIVVIAVALIASFAIWRWSRTAQQNAEKTNTVASRRKMVSRIFTIGAGAAALAGVLASPVFSVSPNLGSNFILPVAVVVIAAGTGSIPGIVLTALVVGVIQAGTLQLAPGIEPAVLVGIIALALLVKPSGIFGDVSVRSGKTVPATADPAATPELGHPLLFGLLIVAAIVLQLNYPQLAFPIAIAMLNALFACAIAFLFARTGILSLGHAVFFAAGAYGTGLAFNTGTPIALAWIYGVGLAALLALIAGVLVVRRGAVLGVLVTAALAQAAPRIIGSLDALEGIGGLVLRESPFSIEDQSLMSAMALGILIGGLAVLFLAGRPRRGGAEGAVVARRQVVAFVISGAVAGATGGSLALINTFVDPEFAGLTRSAEGVAVMLLGGVGALVGPIFGASAWTAAQMFLLDLGLWSPAIVGLVLIVTVFALPDGIAGILSGWIARRGGEARLRLGGAGNA